MDDPHFIAQNSTSSVAKQTPPSFPPSSTSLSVTRPGSDSTSGSAASHDAPPQSRVRIRLNMNGINSPLAASTQPNITSEGAAGHTSEVPQSDSTPPILNRDHTILSMDRSPLRLAATNGDVDEGLSRYKSESLSPVPESSIYGSSPNLGESYSFDNGYSRPSPTKPARRRRPEPVFITSRDYAPVPPEIQAEDLQDTMQAVSNGNNTMKRTDPSRMRNSSTKNDAVNGSGSSNGNHGDTSTDALSHHLPNPNLHPFRKMQRVEFNSPPLPLNFTPVDNERIPMIPTYTCTPRQSPSRARPRLFELEEAPVFYPTKEQWADPLSYIQYVGDPEGGNGKAYGIAKIVPPDDWHPDFVLDQNRFRFRTRMQRLNSLSADARASLNYQEQLQKFHAQQGHARVSIPIVDRRPVDLYKLKLTVGSMGGHEAITKARRWADVTRKLDYEESQAAHLAAQIKAAYTRIILPFEKFLLVNRENVRREAALELNKQRTASPEHTSFSASPSSSRGASHAHTAPAHQTDFDWSVLGGGNRSVDDINGGNSSSKRRSARKRADTVKASQSAASRGRSPDTSNGRKQDVILQPGAEEQMCEICLRGDNGTSMLLCDDCNRGFHMYCLDPPLVSVPKSEWYCPPCLVGTGNDYGFDDGETHSLSSFWNRAESFRAAWWSERKDKIWSPPEGQTNGNARAIAGTGLKVAEDDVEREFWRLVHSPDENVEVEYGADVHSTTHGSAMPTLETHPLSPYSRDGWNLNNLPILPGSLLRYIKSDISGMTVPWIYVGMIFSTFCWHNEDHYTYSINYQHFGDTKTWYGVPGSDAHLLEEALRAAAPDLFDQSPDLLFQLVTMMSPDKLKKHGVKVYACDQRANEFVITYPKAYHSGFNHGFNLNEAVNFALPDWIKYGLEGVCRYRQYRKTPVFSHDELVANVYEKSQTVDTAMWLQSSMEEMVKREIEKRNELRRLVPNITEIEEGKDRLESEYQCAYCNVFCYLAQVISEKAEGVACLDHANQVCGIDSPTKWTLRTRFSDEALTIMLAKTVERAAIPTTWRARLRKLIVSSPQPSLRNLRGLLNEGEKIPFEMPEVEDLRNFVDKANRWVDEATTLIAKKHQKRVGTGRDKGKRGGSKGVDEDDDGDVSMTDLADPQKVYELMEETKMIPFDASEVNALRGVMEAIEEFRYKFNQIMQRVNEKGEKPKLLECEEVLSLGNTLNVRLDEVAVLQQYIGKRKWIAEVEGYKELFLQVADVESLIAEGKSFGVGADDPLMMLLVERQTNGIAWKSKAEALLGLSTNASLQGSQRRFKLEEAEELRSVTYKTAIDDDILAKIDDLLKHIKDWTKQCEMLIKDGNSQNQDETEAYKRYSEACRLLRHLEETTITIRDEDKLIKMKTTQEVVERRIAKRLFDLEIEAEPSQINIVATRIKAELLRKLEECCAEEEEICICRSNKGEKGPIARCVECQNVYHVYCLGLDKKYAKEKDWSCPTCKPSKLMPTLMSKHGSKKTVDEIKEIISSDAIHSQERGISTPLHPWGALPTYQSLQKVVTLATRLGETTHAADLEVEAEQVNTIKALLYCPIRIMTSDSTPRDILSTLVEKLYARHDLDANGADKAIVIDSSPLIQGGREAEMTPYEGEDISMMNTTGDVSDGEAPASGKKSRVTGDERKRKRGKRAKFVFEEEVGIFVPINGERVYCLCHKPETGKMISCERCALWFHTTCVHVYSEADLEGEKWICPMCCVKTERKYPQAEVKVKAPGERDANMWLDVRATLRSTKSPVSKIQQWTVEPKKRIALQLESFYPATAPTQQEMAQDKRQRLNDESLSRNARGGSHSSGANAAANAMTSAGGSGSAGVEVLPFHPDALGSVARNTAWNDTKARVTPKHRTPLAEERSRMESQQAQLLHDAGMKNLYSRGVTDAMIQKWYVGWNGQDLVYPRKDRFGQFHDLRLGPRIHLASDDQDGTKLIEMLLKRESEERRRREAGQPLSPKRYHEEVSHRKIAPTPSYSSSSSHHHSKSGSSALPIPRSKPPPTSIDLRSVRDDTRYTSRPVSGGYPTSSIPPYRSSPMVLPPPPPSAPLSSYRPRSPSREDNRSPIYSRSPTVSQQPAPPPPPPPPHAYPHPPRREIMIDPASSSSSHLHGSKMSGPASPHYTQHTTPPSQYMTPLQPSPRSDRPESSYARRMPSYNPPGGGGGSSSSSSMTTSRPGITSIETKSESDEVGPKHSPRLHSISHNAPSLQQQQQKQKQQQQQAATSSSSPLIPSRDNITTSAAKEKSATPEKSLEEFRALARKMRPTATKEEIETMARAAMQ